MNSSTMTTVLPELSAFAASGNPVSTMPRGTLDPRVILRAGKMFLASTTARAILMIQMVVEAKQNLDPVDNGLRTATSASDKRKRQDSGQMS